MRRTCALLAATIVQAACALACGATIALAGAQDQPPPHHDRVEREVLPPPQIERRPLRPPIVDAPSRTVPNAGDQLQLQLYRDLLQTRQRQLEDRAGPQHPFAGIEALRNQQQLNHLNIMGPRR
jgi:hypothetical protein